MWVVAATARQNAERSVGAAGGLRCDALRLDRQAVAPGLVSGDVEGHLAQHLGHGPRVQVDEPHVLACGGSQGNRLFVVELARDAVRVMHPTHQQDAFGAARPQSPNVIGHAGLARTVAAVTGTVQLPEGLENARQPQSQQRVGIGNGVAMVRVTVDVQVGAAHRDALLARRASGLDQRIRRLDREIKGLARGCLVEQDRDFR